MKTKTTLTAAAAILAIVIAGMMLMGASAQPLAANTTLDSLDAPIASFGYPVITVEAGKQVTINFQAAEENLNGCNNALMIPAFGINQRLGVGDNFVTFTPEEVGEYPYFCWMGMIQSTIHVVEPGSAVAGAQAPETSASVFGGCMMGFGNGEETFSGGCCGR